MCRSPPASVSYRFRTRGGQSSTDVTVVPMIARPVPDLVEHPPRFSEVGPGPVQLPGLLSVNAEVVMYQAHPGPVVELREDRHRLPVVPLGFLGGEVVPGQVGQVHQGSGL